MQNDYVWTLICNACRKPYFQEHPFAIEYRKLFIDLYGWPRYNEMREYNMFNFHTPEWAYYDWTVSDNFLIGESK